LAGLLGVMRLMSDHEMTSTIEFKPRPSVLLARLLLAMHGLAVLTTLLFVHHRAVMPVLLLLIGFSYYRSYRKHVLHKGSRAIRRIVWQADGGWFLEDQSGVMREARLRPSSYVHPRLVILNFDLTRSKGRPSVVLCPDSMDTDTLRRLRGRLRTQGKIAADKSQDSYTKAYESLK